MAAPKAKTKMTRSNWSRSKRLNTKANDLARSQNVTVMSRYGSKNIGKYASTYMSRDNAAVPNIDDVSIKSHDIDSDVDTDTISENDISRESMGLKRERRLFDATSDGLTYSELVKKLASFDRAQKNGHTSIIQIVSFSQEYLRNQHILDEHFTDVKGRVARSLDDSKLRIAIKSSISKMASQAGFSELEYVAAIHGNTYHPHVHIAMIETDDTATGRLAAREASDQLAEDVTMDNSIGKSPAARMYDQAHHVTSTVERGMMRQSEIDFFRQEIDNSLTNMSKLVNVRDLEYQQNYASVVNMDVLRHAYHDKTFMNDFSQVAALLKKPIKQDMAVNLALDRRIERMSRTLLSGSDFGQTRYMTVQYQLAIKLSKEQALAKALLIHSAEEPSQETIADYETMGLDPSAYNGVVLTPSEFSDKNKGLNAQIYLDYVERYKSFIEKPSMSNLDGLVLRLPTELNISDNVKKIVSQQDQMLVNMTKSSIYQMLSHVKKEDVVGADVRKSLATSLKSIRQNHISENDETDGNRDEIKAFQKRLRSAGVRKSTNNSELADIVTVAEHGRIVDTAPLEIKNAKKLLVDTYKQNISDLDAMMTVSAGKHLPKEARQDLLEKSRNLREVTLGTGDLSKSGSMLHAALSAEIYNTGSLERVHKLKLGKREELFTGYREATLNKISAINVAMNDLNNGVSFSEPISQQSMRSDLTDTLKDMSDGYVTKLAFVDKVADIAKLPEAEEKEAVTQLMLSQAIWREGMDAGLASTEIEKKIREHDNLSMEDKLAVTLTMTLRELSTNIDSKREDATILANEMSSQGKLESFDANQFLHDHIVHERLASIDESYDSQDISLTNSDVVYDPSNYNLLVDNHNVIKRDIVAKPLSKNDVMQLSVVVKHFDDAIKEPNKTELASLEKERRMSELLSKGDSVILDNEIKMSYDRLVEKDLYEKQQRLSNIYDLELSDEMQSLESYEASVTRSPHVEPTLSNSSKVADERLINKERDDADKAKEVSRSDNNKGKEISR